MSLRLGCGLEMPWGQVIIAFTSKCLQAKLLWSWFALRPNYYDLGLKVPLGQIIMALASRCLEAKLSCPWPQCAFRPNYCGLGFEVPWGQIIMALRSYGHDVESGIDSCLESLSNLRPDHYSCMTIMPDACSYRLISNKTSRRRLRSSASHCLEVPPARLSTVGKRETPTCGTTFRSTPHLHSHSRSSDSVSKLSSSLVPTRTSWYDLLIIIIVFSFFSGISRGPWNNWYYLGHVKQVNDDDDGWWLVIDGWWLMVGDWWLVIDDWWYSNGWLNCMYRNEIDWQFIS